MNARDDRGSATVCTAVLAAALCVVFAAVLAIGQAVVVRHRAGGAADLAALAAADHALEGPSVACGRARRVAVAQGVRVLRCAVRGEIADLTAEAQFGPFASRIRARAGPARAQGTLPAPGWGNTPSPPERPPGAW